MSERSGRGPGGETPRNRAERRAAAKRGGEGGGGGGAFGQDDFLALAGRFIDLANRQNRTIDARNVALAMRWAAARYEAHVARNVTRVPEDEPFVEETVKGYAEMLRQHLADPHVEQGREDG